MQQRLPNRLLCPHWPQEVGPVSESVEVKADIAQNAIDLARVIGIAKPKVAILSAVETVNPKIPSTVDAAALCKMADRGQITGGILDGPLAFDNAINPAAAATKNIVSPVAGETDILIVPDLESGNSQEIAPGLSMLMLTKAAVRTPSQLHSENKSKHTLIGSTT